MKTYKINLMEEELQELIKANGKEISILETEDIEVIITYGGLESGA